MKLTEKEILSLTKVTPKFWRDYGPGREALLAFAHKVIEAELEKQAAGWKLVPVESTEAMQQAFAENLSGAAASFFNWDDWDSAYAALLEAAQNDNQKDTQP